MSVNKYTVVSNYAYIYNKPSAHGGSSGSLDPDNTVTKSNIVVARIPKGSEISGSVVSNNTNWIKIVNTPAKISFINKILAVNLYTQIKNNNGEQQLSLVTTTNGNSNGTTEAKTNTSGKTINTTGDGTVSTSEPSSSIFHIDDSFTVSYLVSNPSDEQYKANISGLRIQDIRGILGAPHQFLPSADARLNASSKGPGTIDSLGRLYSDKIIKQIPLLLITPGVPSFMSSFSEEQKSVAISNLLGGRHDVDLDALVNDHSGKYYTLKYAYTSYFYYVNAMLRSAAYFLGIQNRKINNKKLSTFNWLYYTTDPDGKNSDIFGNEGLKKFLGPYAGCIAFYADCGNQVDDTFSNSTSQSQLSSALNSLSDSGRELNFLVGNIGSEAGLSLTEATGSGELQDNMEKLHDIVNNSLGSNSVLGSILNKATTILAGGRMVFPEIWSDSSFSRSYNCKMKLVSPSGDKFSVFLNILVPIYHLLALTLPRQSMGQSYFSPFLVRAYSKGLFNIDMGIISDLSITKGAEGEWTKDGIPTVADVSFTIKDLYQNLFMSYAKTEGDSNIMSNITELDYIANSCGVNINDHEIGRTLKMYVALEFTGRIEDAIQIGIFGNLSQFFNQKLNNIFGAFN